MMFVYVYVVYILFLIYVLSVDLLFVYIVDVGLSLLFFFVFFFKQKTAYEMRISDWSSDVCSSDLLGDAGLHGFGRSAGIVGADVDGRGSDVRILGDRQIGRASCRERVCQYV